MRASIIWVPHSGHSGHTIRVVGRGGVSTGNPLISAALEKISHRTGKETVQYCSHAAPRDTRQWQRHAQCRANSYPCPIFCTAIRLRRSVGGGIAPQGVKRQFVLDVTRRSKGPCSYVEGAAGNLRPQLLPPSRARPPAVRNCPTKSQSKI